MTENVFTTNIRIAELELGVFTPRKQFSLSYIEELAESIRREGQLKPILVRLHPKEPDKYQVVDGEHRTRALKKLGETLARAEVRKLSDEEAFILAMRINQMHGKRLEEIEEAIHIKRMMDAFGYAQQKIGEIFQKSQDWVSRRLKLAENLAPEVAELFTRRLVKAEHAIELAELPKEDQTKVAEKVVEKKLPTRATRALVHAYKKAQTPEEKQMILSKPVEVYAELYKQREALDRALLPIPDKPVFQRFDCPCGCGYSLWIDWNEMKAWWQRREIPLQPGCPSCGSAHTSTKME